jgi:hypothetical protein
LTRSTFISGHSGDDDDDVACISSTSKSAGLVDDVVDDLHHQQLRSLVLSVCSARMSACLHHPPAVSGTRGRRSSPDSGAPRLLRVREGLSRTGTTTALFLTRHSMPTLTIGQWFGSVSCGSGPGEPRTTTRCVYSPSGACEKNNHLMDFLIIITNRLKRSGVFHLSSSRFASHN